MAKVGYIFIATNGEEYAEDKAWMQQYGCVQVIEELSEHERLRPMWKQLISSLERGDELVVSRFSNALRGTRELATLIEYCRVKVVRIIPSKTVSTRLTNYFPTPSLLRSSVCLGHYLRSVPCCARHRLTSFICNRISDRPRSRKGHCRSWSVRKHREHVQRGA